MDHNSGNYSSPWAAVLGHHHSMTSDPSFTHGLPVDLHVSQGFSYYRYNYSIISPQCPKLRKAELIFFPQNSSARPRI